METLHNSLEDVSSALPVSFYNVSLQLLHTKAAPGHPSTSRLASSMDNFRTGAKRKLSRAHTSNSDGKDTSNSDGKVEKLSSDKENIEGKLEVWIDDYSPL